MKRPLTVSLLCLLGALALLFWGFNPSGSSQPPPERRYVLLIESDTGTFLMQLRKGMQEAVALQGARLTVEIVAGDPAVQAREVAAVSPTAVLLLLTRPALMLEALAEVDIPAVVIGQTIRGQVCVISDDEDGGAAYVYRALEMAEAEQILLLTDEEDPRAVARSFGALAKASPKKIQTMSWSPEMEIPSGYSVFLAASTRVTQWLAMAKAEGRLAAESAVLGVDTGDSRVQDLEQGYAEALLMDNPYAMGFLAIEKAQMLAESQLIPSLHFYPSPLIDLGNMHLIENVKLVFPLLQ